MDENRIRFINSYYNPTADQNSYELFISLTTTQETLRVPSGNYQFLTKVALGYVMTEPNIYQICINLSGEFVVRYQRLSNGRWLAHFGYGETRDYSTDMLIGHLKGANVAPAFRELNQ